MNEIDNVDTYLSNHDYEHLKTIPIICEIKNYTNNLLHKIFFIENSTIFCL